ncbi:ABC transporter ATP-binding protein/permease [Lachnoclostridium sp. 210928-DFI.6.3]|nr:ABC transporter ATP-binding protein/permease [Lachnoclostridium sp. 210928-DFI.6.3]
MGYIRWFLSFLKKYRVRMIVGLILVFITALLVLINPQISGMIVDEVIEGQHYEKLGILLLIMIGVTLVRSLLRFTFLMCFESSSQGLVYDMREEAYRKLMKEDFNFFNKNRTGDLMSRQTGDMDAVRHMVSHVIYFSFENILVFLMALVMIFSVNVKMALCMLIVLPFTLAVTLSQRRHIKPAFDRVCDCFSSLNAFAQETIAGNRVVKAFAKEDYELEKFDRENDGYRDAQLNAASIWMKYIPMFEILSQCLTIILMIMGGFMVIDGEMTIGNMVTVNGYLWMLNSPLRQAGWIINDLQRFLTAIEKIYKVYTTEPDIKQPEHVVEKRKLKGSVTFDHVNYYTNDDTVLKDISFHVEPGQTVGIIGATGSGKSSLINLICRFYDVNQGRVLVDDIDVRNLNLQTLRGNIGIAMQDVFLFSDTIEGNIAYGNPDCTFEQVQAAAKIANADEFIREMPEGYDTIIGERGVGLSGGQKQRISLARAILKDPSIIILDDTTSAIDMETESMIQNELKKISDERTVFIIAHRISSIIHADQILVLDNGRLVERGTHEQLLAKKGYYSTVFHHQYGEFDRFKKVRAEKGRGEA